MSQIPNVTAKNIERHLDLYVVGQGDAKRMVSVNMYLHYLRSGLRINTKENFKKSNFLVIGPTGSGKTLMVRRATEALGFPFIEINAKELSLNGYVGNSLEDLIITQCNKLEGYKYDLANYSVIFIDEVDKLCACAPSTHHPDHNREIQVSLLKAVEGIELRTSAKQNELRTHNMLFVFAGSFEEIRKKRGTLKKYMGFSEPNHVRTVDELDIHEELIDAGFVPELAGRISCISECKKLNKKELRNALLSTEDSAYSSYKKMFDLLDRDLQIPEAVIKKIINKCDKAVIGARGLEAAMDEELRDLVYNLE